jgi:hypothetical protein
MIGGVEGLAEDDREACRFAVRYLQIGFHAMLPAAEKENVPVRLW